MKMKLTALIFNVTNLCHKSCLHRQTGKKILPKSCRILEIVHVKIEYPPL